MPDVSTLGLGVDSSGVVKATDALDKLAPAANKAAGAATGMEKGATGMATAMTGAVVKGTLLVDALEKVAMFAYDAAKQMFHLAVELGRYQDMAEMTQADPAGLASLQTAADVAGVEMETVMLSMNRLSNSLAGVEDDGKKAGKALESIGINIEEFKALAPDEQYRKIAVALEGFGASGDKVAVVMALMGRGGGQQLKMMHELANETERSTIVTNDTIKSMDDFHDALKRSQSRLEQMTGVAMAGTIPAILALKETTIGAVEQLFNLDKESGKLALQDGVKTFAHGAAVAIGALVDVLEGPIRLFRVLGATLGGLAAAVSARNPTEAKGILADMRGTVDDILMEKSFLQKLNDKWDENEAKAKAPKAAEVDKPKVHFDPNKEEAGSKAKDIFNDLMLTLQKKLDLEREELALGRKLTEEEKLRIEVLAQVKRAKQDMSAAQMKDIDTLLTAIGVSAKDIELQDKRLKAVQAYAEEMHGIVEAELKRRDSLIEVRDKEEEALRNYGKSVVALQDLEVLKLRDAAATLRQAAVMAGEYNPEARVQVRLLQEQADALESTARAREQFNKRVRTDEGSGMVGAKRAVDDYLDSVADAAKSTQHVVGNALKQTEDAMTDLFTGKTVDVRAFIDTLIAEFMRLTVVRPLLASILNAGGAGGGGGGWGALLGLFGGAAGAASTGAEMSAAAGMAIGTFAAGGRPPVNEPSWVGEKGIELLVPDAASTIIPSSKLSVGGKQITFAPSTTINIDSRSDAAQIRVMVEQANVRSNKALLQQMKAQGVF